MKEMQDEFRSTRTEALILLGSYDIDESTERIRERLNAYHAQQRKFYEGIKDAK